ncbi:hypothetical protein RL73_00895 [Liberibacter crescens]|nr:hypothetical protein RL73_00895 [Liberibacter crescens]
MLYLLFSGRYLQLLIAGIFLSLLSNLVAMLVLGFSGWLITSTAIAGFSGITKFTFDIITPSAVIRFLAIARTISRYAERYVTHNATLSVLSDLREALFRGWAAPNSSKVLAKRPARILFRLTSDIDILDTLYLRGLVPMVVAISSSFILGVGLFYFSPLFGILIFLFIISMGFGLSFISAFNSFKPCRRRAYAMEALRARIIDFVIGKKDIVMSGRLDLHNKIICSAESRLAHANSHLNKIETYLIFGFGAVSTAFISIILLKFESLVQENSFNISKIVFFIFITLVAIDPFMALKRGILDLGYILLAIRRISPRLTSAPLGRCFQEPSIFGLAVQLSDVCVRHEENPKAVFSCLSLEIKKGEHVALLGCNGSGKSTLLSVISREISLEKGIALSINSTLLPQRSELFLGNLRDNLQLAAPTVSDAALYQVLADIGLNIKELPYGLDTKLGEGGIGLSGGQLKRVALARLLLQDTPMWLLDEPTEGIDSSTAQDIIDRILYYVKDRTLVIATHIRRDALMADHVVLIGKGSISDHYYRGEPEFEVALSNLKFH